jgi:hypothetical protein
MLEMISNRPTRHMLVIAAVAGCACLMAGTATTLAQTEPPTAPPPPASKLVVDATSVTIYQADKPVLRYRYAEVAAKPYVDRLYTPGGVNILRDSPSDHKHHHGLMFALAVDGTDFWSETPGCGSQAHQEIGDVRTGVGNGIQYAGFVDGRLAWVDPKTKAAVLFEDRRIELVQMKGQKATLLTWETTLSLPEGKSAAALSGAEYFGLGMRFVTSMDKGGKFINADGKTGVKDTNAARSTWCAYTAAVDGKPVTVAVFDSPANPRRPATWFTMDTPFAYLAATMALNKEPLNLKEDPALPPLRYGVALWDGQVEAREIEALYRQWVGLFQPPQPAGPGPASQPAGEPKPAPPAPGQ